MFPAAWDRGILPDDRHSGALPEGIPKRGCELSRREKQNVGKDGSGQVNRALGLYVQTKRPGGKAMRNVLMFILALVVVWIVWKIVMGFVFSLLSIVITIGMILLFCYLVYAVFKALTKQKI